MTLLHFPSPSNATEMADAVMNAEAESARSLGHLAYRIKRDIRSLVAIEGADYAAQVVTEILEKETGK